MAALFAPAKDSTANDFKRGNCSLFVVLKQISTGREFQVVCNHFHWNPQRDFVKLAQAINACKHARADLPLLFCGDLNSHPDSNVYGYLTSKDAKVVPYRKVQKKKIIFYNEVQEKLQSPLKGCFKSAYANYCKLSHPDFTAYSIDCKHAIDYIMHTDHF